MRFSQSIVFLVMSSKGKSGLLRNSENCYLLSFNSNVSIGSIYISSVDRNGDNWSNETVLFFWEFFFPIGNGQLKMKVLSFINFLRMGSTIPYTSLLFMSCPHPTKVQPSMVHLVNNSLLASPTHRVNYIAKVFKKMPYNLISKLLWFLIFLEDVSELYKCCKNLLELAFNLLTLGKIIWHLILFSDI